jgi:hypothetical protein
VSNQSGQPVSGYPEFWQKAHDAFAKFFEVAPRVQAALNDLTGRGYQSVEPYQKVVLNLALLTGVAMTELVTLVGNGLGHGAMKIARGILEGAINAEYFRRFPGECEDYLQWHWVEQHKLLNYVREHSPKVIEHLQVENMERIEKEFDAVRSRFEYTTAEDKKKLRGSWCSLDLGTRAAKTDFLESYRTINPLASQILHGSIGGLAMHFDLDEDVHRIAVPPSLDYCGEALVGGHLCMVKIVETLTRTFGTKPCHPVEELVRDFHYAWEKPSEREPA